MSAFQFLDENPLAFWSAVAWIIACGAFVIACGAFGFWVQL